MDEQLDNVAILKKMILTNQKREKHRSNLIRSIGNPDVFCHKMQNEVCIQLFDSMLEAASEIGNKEMIADKLQFRAFIDTEVNYVNDVLQSKTFDLVEATYIPSRESFLNGEYVEESKITKMIGIEELIGKFLNVECQILTIYTRLPFDTIKKLHDENSDKKRLLKGIKLVMEKGIGISSKKGEREKLLKDIEVEVFDLNIIKPRTTR